MSAFNVALEQALHSEDTEALEQLECEFNCSLLVWTL